MIKQNTPLEGMTHRYFSAFVRVFVLAAFLVVAVQSSVAAVDTRVTFVNRTGQTIMKGQFSAVDNPNWGSDQLKDYIRPGQSYTVTFNSNWRYWDCKFTLRDGTVRWKYDLDVYKVGTLYID